MNEAQILEAAVKVKQGSGSSLLFSAGGEDFLYLLEPIDRLHVDLVNVISLHGTYSKIDSTRNKVILIISLLLVLLAVITYWIQSIVLKKSCMSYGIRCRRSVRVTFMWRSMCRAVMRSVSWRATSGRCWAPSMA
ncbi:hypothetical protein ACFTAO_31930 [Paenibacillus rhizoplanae]